jgi:predicted ATP-binding protein involved in virulence
MDYQEQGHAIVVDKRNSDNYITVELSQMSSGEKAFIAVVADLSLRLMFSNSNSDNPLYGSGVIIIDEIDLHLHPSWQQQVVRKLREIFPKVQFLITTHSAMVLSNIYSKHILELYDGEIYGVQETYGQSGDTILEDSMGTIPLLKKDFERLFELIDENKIMEAKRLIEELESKIEGKHPDIIKAKMFIQRKELLGQ